MNKPEVIISIIGWVVTYLFVIKAQKKQHKNEINHEVYKDLIFSLDQYAAELSAFSSKLQSFHITSVYRHLGTEELQIMNWINEVRTAGNNLRFYLFLQKWESYEIFLQNLNTVKLTFNKEQGKVTDEFLGLLLLQEPSELIKKDRENFLVKLDHLWEESMSLSMYILDMKIILQNYFYGPYGLKRLSFRKPEDPKYKVLTEKGFTN